MPYIDSLVKGAFSQDVSCHSHQAGSLPISQDWVNLLIDQLDCIGFDRDGSRLVRRIGMNDREVQINVQVFLKKSNCSNNFQRQSDRNLQKLFRYQIPLGPQNVRRVELQVPSEAFFEEILVPPCSRSS